MPWLIPNDSGSYHVAFRYLGRKYRRTLRTGDRREAECLLARVEDNLRLIERGRIVIPSDVDVASFLMSDCRIAGPETCFVGVSFHHFRTSKRHLVHSSLAQAFSSEGEGFAIRGEGVPSDRDQGRNTKLSGQQAELLGRKVLAEYMERTGAAPLRMVVHKTSQFDDAEIEGFNDAFRNIPVVSMVTLIPSPFRLLRFVQYPVTIGTVCTVNAHRTYLYTTGFMPSLGTYPGPHIPEPFEIRSFGDDEPADAVKDIFALSRMNWNTADVRGKWPVTLSFARRVGGVLDEYGDEQPAESSLRYFM